MSYGGIATDGEHSDAKQLKREDNIPVDDVQQIDVQLEAPEFLVLLSSVATTVD